MSWFDRFRHRNGQRWVERHQPRSWEEYSIVHRDGTREMKPSRAASLNDPKLRHSRGVFVRMAYADGRKTEWIRDYLNLPAED